MAKRVKRKRRNKKINIAATFLLVLCVVAITCVAVVAGSSLLGKDDETSLPQIESSVDETITSSQETIIDSPEYVMRGEHKLNADYSRLLLVNSQNPLPADYEYGWNLTEIEKGYNNGQLTQIDAGIWPYMKAMIDAAWADGVKLYVWSPYRSFETQNMLFQNQVQRTGGDENAAAQVVARPGTSEHNTGLCADFNMASDAFEQTSMFEWMKQNAADYGFILRYPENKIDITGVIYESWHWRFVGINAAKEINSMGLTLEEYITYKQLGPQADLYGGAVAE